MKLDRLWPYYDEQPEEGADDAGVPDDEVEDVEADADVEESSSGDTDDEGDEQSLRDFLKAEGFESDAEDDMAAIKALMEQAKNARTVEQRLAELEQQRQYEAYARAQQQQFQPQQRPSTPVNPYEAVSETSPLRLWKQRPEFNPRWLNMVQRDEKGSLVPISGADPTLPHKVTQYLEWQREATDSIVADPIRLVKEAMYADPEVSAAINAMIESRIGQLKAEWTAKELTEKSVNELFKVDESGKPVRDRSGSLIPTDYGREYQKFVQMLSNQGIHDPEQQHQMASLMAKGAVGSVKKEDSTESRAKKQFRFLKNSATKTKNKSASPSRSGNEAISSVNDLEQEILRQLMGTT